MLKSKHNPADQMERRVGCNIGNFSTDMPGRYNLTNIVSAKNQARFVMPPNSFVGDHKTIKLQIWGSASGSGAKSLHFAVVNNITFDKYYGLHTAPLGELHGDFYLEIVVTAMGRRDQTVFSTLITASDNSRIDNSLGRAPFNTERIFRIYGETAMSDAVLTVKRYEMFVCG